MVNIVQQPEPRESSGAAGNRSLRWLPDRAFHFQLDQALELDAVFHRELAHEIVDEAVHAKAHRLRFTQTALLHIEDLLCAYLADAGFVLHRVARATHG